MFESEVQRKIEDFRELGLSPYIRRNNIVHIGESSVSTIIGARRAGKSCRLRQVVDDLINDKFIDSIEQVCMLDFDNPILAAAQAYELKKIQEVFFKVSPSFTIKTPLVFVLDEIHKIIGWEQYVIDLSRNPYWKVFVSGSSSKLLADDISTELRGKSIKTIIYPLTFREFLKFHGITEPKFSTKGAADLSRLFDSYLKWGSFPAIVNTNDMSKDVLLREYFDTMILKDIIQRYNVSKPKQCIQLYNYLVANISKPFTIDSAYSHIRQNGYPTSKDALKDYINWAEDSWFIFNMPIHTDSSKEIERNYKKVYCIDWALANQCSPVWDGKFSRALENVIYIHLRQKFPRIRYYLTKSKREEIDFIALNNNSTPQMLVQTCFDITSKETLAREISPITKTCSYFNIKEAFIITMNRTEFFTENGVKIYAVPAYKWLLDNF